MWEVYHEAGQQWPYEIRRQSCGTKAKAYATALADSAETGGFVAVHRNGIEIASFLRGKLVREC
jgi:hypothetical protein